MNAVDIILIHFLLLQLTNTLQVVLATDGTLTFVLFHYANIQWSSRTTIGFNAGDRIRSYTLPESLTADGIFSLPRKFNAGIAGTFIFRVDQALIEVPPPGIGYYYPPHACAAGVM